MNKDTLKQSQKFSTLIEGVLPMAERMLDELGAFLPYAAVLYRNGDIRHLTIDPNSGHHDTQDILSALEKSLSDLVADEDQKATATAICLDIQMRPTTDDPEFNFKTKNMDQKSYKPDNFSADNQTKIDQVDDNVDCIMLRLENIDGQALDAFRPYAIDHSGHVRFSRMFATHSEPKNFKS